MHAEAAVIDTVNLFHLCVDRRDWTAARRCLADTVRLSSHGQDAGQEMPAARFLGMIRANVESFTATQHFAAGHHVDLADDATARCQSSFQYHHVSAAGRWVMAGRHDARLRHTPAGWRITAVTLEPAWEEGPHPAPSS